jgi:hypothetical protein
MSISAPGGIVEYITFQTSMDTGTATSGNSTTINDTGKAWSTNQWREYYVTITAGTNAGETRKITAGGVTSLSVSPAFSAAIDVTSVYMVHTQGNCYMDVLGYRESL